jgi:chromosome segregation ATPase
MNSLKEAVAHIEVLEEKQSELERALTTISQNNKDLKEVVSDALLKFKMLDGQQITDIPRTVFEKIDTTEFFTAAYRAHYEGVMRAYPQLRDEGSFTQDTANTAINIALKATVALIARAGK